MVKTARKINGGRRSPVSGRVSKRPREPSKRQQRCPPKQRKTKVKRSLLQEEHSELLTNLELPTIDVNAAVAKFTAFVEVDKLADELDYPKSERLISADARLSEGYRTLSIRRKPGDLEPKIEVFCKGKKQRVSFDTEVRVQLDLTVGSDTNWDLVKEREHVIVEKCVDEKKDKVDHDAEPSKATDESLKSEPQPKVKPLQICGFIKEHQNFLITVNATCMAGFLEAFKTGPIELYIDINTLAQKAQLEAIKRVESLRFIQGKLAYNVVTTVNASNAISAPPSPPPPPVQPSNPSETSVNEPSTSNINLNEEQRRAVAQITRDDTSRMFMLFGPPGTGKTFTLVKAIVELIRSNRRVIICTPSNKAADVISCGILNEGIVGLYRHVSQTLDESSVHPQVRKHAGFAVDNDEYDADDDSCDLDDYSVVVSTLGSTPSLRKAMRKAKKVFSHIIVDEAGQAAEMEVWLPLAFFADEKTRLIVAGDPMQLGPVTELHLLDDPVYGYKDSILSRLYHNEAFRSDIQNMVLLTKNYRSHESIVKVVSQIFYEDKLEFTRPAGHDSLSRWHRLPKNKFPVFFESVYGRVQTDSNGSSSNEVEADAVVFYVESLLRWRVKAHEIGVVSPYTAQTDLIRRRLGSSSEVTVDTVEKYQGSERRVIIVTAVRNGKALGFMEDRQRLNTALSRAQQLLIVIGHARSLKVLPDWKKFIDYCKEHDAYVKRPVTAKRKH